MRRTIFRDFSYRADKIKSFLVDTNLIIYLERKTRDDVVNFIKKSGYRFFYTETVKDELSFNKNIETDQIIKERDKYFTLVDSGISKELKEDTRDMLFSILKREGTNLSNSRIKSFSNDLFIIMEAGFVCYNKELRSSHNYFDAPELLITNNMKLLRTFIENPQNKQALENSINLNGLEHLIDIIDLDTILKEWVENTLQKDSSNLLS